MNKQNEARLLIFLVLLLLVVNYPLLDRAFGDFIEGSETGLVGRIIDGDTIEIENDSIRLLGINSPERGEEYYTEAKNYLETLSLNNVVQLKKGKEDRDRYNRELRYIFIGTTNLNLELVKKGLANPYFPDGKSQYYNEFFEAWKECIDNEVNLCEPSENKCSVCINLKNIDVKNQEVILENVCGFSCNLDDWTIKDEGRKKFEFPNFELKSGREVIVRVGSDVHTEEVVYWSGEDYVWTNSGDTLFLRDGEGKLVLWENY